MDGARAVNPGRVAAVDIGTNTVRLLVAESRAPGLPGHGPLVNLDRRVDVVRLGQGVDATGRLSDAAVARTIASLTSYGDAIRSWRPEHVKVVATSATRDAANRDPFLEAVELAVGTPPEVISGDREAALAFAGVVSAMDVDGTTVVVDVGGGSTEFVHGGATVEHAASVDIGSVRLTERVLGDGPHRPDRIEAARLHVDDLLEDLVLPEAPDRVVGVAGTFTSIAALHLGLETYDSDRVDGARLSVEELTSVTERLAALSTQEIAAFGAIDSRRAGVLTGGAVVAERSVAATGVNEVTISESDLLDGVALWAAGLLG